jgi:hypothetical protein
VGYHSENPIYIGKKFNYLTVVKKLETSNGNQRIKCLCDCGKFVIVYRSNLCSGITQSCSCKKALTKLTRLSIESRPLRVNSKIRSWIVKSKPIYRLDGLLCQNLKCSICKEQEVLVPMRSLDLYGKKSCKLCHKWSFVGKRFGFLTVRSWDIKSIYYCSCDCGEVIKTSKQRLERNFIRSCGCARYLMSAAKKNGFEDPKFYSKESLQQWKEIQESKKLLEDVRRQVKLHR